MSGALYHAHPAQSDREMRTPFYEGAGAYLPTGFFASRAERKRLAEERAARRAAYEARAIEAEARFDAWFEAL